MSKGATALDAYAHTGWVGRLQATSPKAASLQFAKRKDTQMTRSCNHDIDAWVEVKLEWCRPCSSWLYRLEVVQPDSRWAGYLERLCVKSRFLPVEDTTPDDTLYLAQTAFAVAQEAASGEYRH